MKIGMDFEDVLMDLGFDSPKEAANELSVEASKCRNAALDIFSIRDSVIRSRFHEETPQQDIEDNFDALLTACFNYVSEIPITESVLPPAVFVERREYRDLLKKDIDKASRVNVSPWLSMLQKMERVVSGSADYLEGPVRAHRIMDGWNEPYHLEKQKRETAMLATGYIINVELDRVRRYRDKNGREQFYSIGKIPARGNKPFPAATARLIYGLHDLLLEPKEQLVGLSGEQVEEYRENFGNKLRKLQDVRKMFSNKLRKRMRVRRVLMDSDKVLETMLGEIKPLTPLDLASAHPSQLQYRNMIAEDEELSERTKEVLEAYIIELGGLHCSQIGIYDILFDVVYGYPPEVFWVLNSQLTSSGYQPIPGFENLPPEKVVDPTSDFKFYRLMPKIARYDVKVPPSGIIA